MKYMIMMFGGLGASLADRSPEWITNMQAVMMRMDGELRESGEAVDSRHLMDPSQATTVRFHNGAQAPTDGPFAEIKESLAGYWIIEGSQRGGGPGDGRSPLRTPVQVDRPQHAVLNQHHPRETALAVACTCTSTAEPSRRGGPSMSSSELNSSSRIPVVTDNSAATMFRNGSAPRN